MSEPGSSTNIPDDIGRNDPCPCGSGRKYKKCCQRAHRLQKESEKKNPEPHHLIEADSIPWDIYKILSQIRENNALGLFYDIAHDAGPLRDRYADKTSLIKAVNDGDEILPAGPSFDLVHLRLDPPDTILLLQKDDPKNKTVSFQLVTLRPNEVSADGGDREVEHAGFRLWDFRRELLDRADLDGTPSLDIFGIDWHPPS